MGAWVSYEFPFTICVNAEFHVDVSIQNLMRFTEPICRHNEIRMQWVEAILYRYINWKRHLKRHLMMIRRFLFNPIKHPRKRIKNWRKIRFQNWVFTPKKFDFISFKFPFPLNAHGTPYVALVLFCSHLQVISKLPVFHQRFIGAAMNSLTLSQAQH